MSAPIGSLFASGAGGLPPAAPLDFASAAAARLAQYLPRRAGRRAIRRRRSSTPPLPVDAGTAWPVLRALGDGMDRVARYGEFPARRQAQWVARSALMNYPDIIVAELVPGPAGRRALPLFPQPVRLVRHGRQPQAGRGLAGRLRRRAAAALILPPPPDLRRRPMRRLSSFLADAWRIAGPFWRSEERWRARLLLGVVVVLNLSLVGMSVLLSYWNREFFNSLQEKDAEAFWALLFWWRQTDSGPMPGFVFVAVLYILIAVYQLYLRQALQIRWRGWMTRQVLDRWLADRAYYRIALTDPGTDNPDQRVAEDLRMFVDNTLALGLGLMRSVVTLFSFILVLWGLSGPATLFGIEIPGYMVWVALALCGGRHRAGAFGRPAR